jgi:hypothetical protein
MKASLAPSLLNALLLSVSSCYARVSVMNLLPTQTSLGPTPGLSN